jgi:hypothetical protein
MNFLTTVFAISTASVSGVRHESEINLSPESAALREALAEKLNDLHESVAERMAKTTRKPVLGTIRR